LIQRKQAQERNTDVELKALLVGHISLPNVRDHRHRTDGATDAREAEIASGVTAGRCSVDRSVRIFDL